MTAKKNEQTNQREGFGNEIMSQTEAFYEGMKAIRDKIIQERSEFPGISPRSIALDENLAHVNSVINALAPLYVRRNLV